MILTYRNLKIAYVVSCLILGLIILAPTLSLVVTLPVSSERFSELWVLGSEHTAENNPLNVKVDEYRTVYLGVRNHMRDLEYYVIYVKLRNQSEPLPDIANGTASGLRQLFEYRVVLEDGDIWEKQIQFAVDSVSFDGNSSKVMNLLVDGYALGVNETALWDPAKNGFYYQLFFGLWRFDYSTSHFEFHDRFVGLWLNATATMS